MTGRQVIKTNRAFTLEELAQFMQEHWNKDQYNHFIIGRPTAASVEKYILLPATGRFMVIVFPRKAGGLFSRDNKVVLTAFIPMLMDTGGNSGSQSSVTVIRALSLGELEFSDIPAVIWKEIRTAAMCGIVLAAACFAKIMLIDRLLLGNSDVTLIVALVVCCTMALTVIVAKLIGCTLPLLAKKAGFDPAVMASPFITTIVDAVSLLVYFGIASTVLF